MTGLFYGYARVSTSDQDLTIQREALTRAGCTVIREETASGTSLKGRTELETLLEFIRPGDTLVITRIDRLARSMRDLQNVVHDLRARGVHLRATEQPIDTSNAAGKAFLDMLGVFAEFETNLRDERQKEGIVKGKEKGVFKGGGARRIDHDKVRTLHASGRKPVEIHRELGISRRSVFAILKLPPAPPKKGLSKKLKATLAQPKETAAP